MPGTPILYDDWKDYDNHKLRDNCDNNIFCCKEHWEVSYLVWKIRKHHPFPEAAIRDAIAACCRASPLPVPRSVFVHSVMKRLAGE